MLITRLINGLILHRRRRRTTLELAGLSEKRLEDFGLTRHDLLAVKRPR
jgi:uncharacterized protein YjiS (DUF1127 family)